MTNIDGDASVATARMVPLVHVTVGTGLLVLSLALGTLSQSLLFLQAVGLLLAPLVMLSAEVLWQSAHLGLS